MLKAGTRVGEFEVLSLLGAGGMGEVYRAQDARLQREVALKVLPAETLTDEKARARLLREARMAGKLNHPHVCTIHEVGEAEGQVHIAMELVEGKTLATMLGSGRLPTEQAQRYGIQVADALAHAHGRGVVHRDLKSGNVVITPEGRAKVLDFGLAKPLVFDELSDAATTVGAPLTEPGSPAGTLAYMAPEQLRGQPADARSDIWALGVVLHEMVGGRRPFVAETGPALSAAILKESPEPLPEIVPATLRAVIERCLAKEPGERYQRAEEVRAALETAQSGGGTLPTREDPSSARRGWLAMGAMAAAVILALLVLLTALNVGGMRDVLLGPDDSRQEVIRVAVLPFANLSGDPEEEYFADGFTQEMTTQLARLHPESLRVIARTSVMRYKGGNKPVDEIGGELGVDYVLEGGTQREAGRVRITAELINVLDQTQLWADTFERDLAGILVVQSEVAEQVAEALALELLPAEQARLASVQTVDPQAHDAYLRGSYHLMRLTPEDFDAALLYFEMALENDPNYAPAYSGIADFWISQQQLGIRSPAEAGPKAKEAALRAIALDDQLAVAHGTLAAIRTFADWDWDGAWPEWRRALELDPNAAMAHAFYAHFLAIVGRNEEATRHSERALELDPFNALYHGLYAMVLYADRRYDDAMAAAETALAMQPGLLPASNIVLAVLISKGLRDEQLAHQRERIARDPELVAAFERGLEEGGHEGAQRAIADLMATRYETAGRVPNPGVARIYLPVDIALRYLDAGDHEKAIDWLEEAFEVGDPNLPYIGPMPSWDPVRSNARFQEVLRRMNLPTTRSGSDDPPAS